MQPGRRKEACALGFLIQLWRLSLERWLQYICLHLYNAIQQECATHPSPVLFASSSQQGLPVNSQFCLNTFFMLSASARQVPEPQLKNVEALSSCDLQGCAQMSRKGNWWLQQKAGLMSGPGEVQVMTVGLVANGFS